VSVAVADVRPPIRESPVWAVGEALAAGLILYGLSWLWAEHDLRTGVFGNVFRRMSETPFRSGSPFEFRFLVPLIGRLTGLYGERYLVLSEIGGVALLTLVYLWARRFHGSRTIAALLAGALAFLQPIQFNHVAPGRADVFAYVWLLGAMLAPRWSALFVFLGLATHEFFLLYVPWIVLLHLRFDRERWLPGEWSARRRAFELLAAFAAYGAARWAIAAANDFGVRLTAGHYWALVKDDWLVEWRRQPVLLGAIVSLKLFWVLGAWAAIRRARLGGRRVTSDLVLLAWPVAGAIALLLVAHDTSRFLGHAFPFVLLLPRYLPKPRATIGAAVALNFLIPSFYLGADWWAPCDPWAKRLAPRVERILYSPRGTYRAGWWHSRAAADRSKPAPGSTDEETR